MPREGDIALLEATFGEWERGNFWDRAEALSAAGAPEEAG